MSKALDGKPPDLGDARGTPEEFRAELEKLKRTVSSASTEHQLRATCQPAVAAFGTEYQLRKTQEECCELGAAINQYLDGKISAEELAGEAADVEITATYVRLAIGDALVDEAKARKLDRLRGIVRAKVESDNG